MENGEKVYMQNIINNDQNGYDQFYQYEGQYTEFQKVPPGSDLFTYFQSFKPDIEYELGRQFT